MHGEPLLSIIMATYNRRQVLLDTLARVTSVAREVGESEIIVVDNRSKDGTAATVREAFPEVELIRAPANLGPCAKALGVERARGLFTLFLDDDSYPRPGSLSRMIEHLQADRFLGAVGFQVHLSDGSKECCALPNVFVGCGVGFRTAMLRAIGSLDPSLFMAAEEYDLAFRMVSAGWRVRCFDDCHVDHLKTPSARSSGRLMYYDTRNNILVLARYLPTLYYSIYRQDWIQRYRWLARQQGLMGAHLRGLVSGYACGIPDRRLYRPLRLDESAVEVLFRIDEIFDKVSRLRRRGVKRVILGELGKNIYPFYRACRQCEVEIAAVGDDRFAATGRFYREIPVLPVADALEMGGDAVIISNTSPVHAYLAGRRWRTITDLPVHDWFGRF